MEKKKVSTFLTRCLFTEKKKKFLIFPIRCLFQKKILNNNNNNNNKLIIIIIIKRLKRRETSTQGIYLSICFIDMTSKKIILGK